MPFSRGPSQPRNQTGVSCTAGGFFISWTTGHMDNYFLPIWMSNSVNKGYYFQEMVPYLQLNTQKVCIPIVVVMLVTQLCPTLYHPIDCSPPGSSVHGILQARILEWVAIPFSTWSSWPRGRTQLSQIAGRFFTVWLTREAHIPHTCLKINSIWIRV